MRILIKYNHWLNILIWADWYKKITPNFKLQYLTVCFRLYDQTLGSILDVDSNYNFKLLLQTSTPTSNFKLWLYFIFKRQIHSHLQIVTSNFNWKLQASTWKFDVIMLHVLKMSSKLLVYNLIYISGIWVQETGKSKKGHGQPNVTNGEHEWRSHYLSCSSQLKST